MPPIRMKRGNRADAPTSLLAGEPIVTLDTHEIAIGDSSGNRQWAKVRTQNIIDAGEANGVAVLDANGKIDTSQLPANSSYRGAFDASVGSMPVSPAHGDEYRVSVGGTINSVVYNVGDRITYNSFTTTWDKFDGVDEIVSVNGQTGAVSLTTSNINEGVNLYYTDSRADSRANARISANRNSANGLAGLDSSSLILSSQLPTIDGGTY